MAKAKLIYRSKLIYPDGAIREMVIWQLPQKTPERLHALKYRLYYGDSRGNCLIRYDNETGKGDHKHVKGEEYPYNFTDVKELVDDFQYEINQLRGGHEK